MGRVQRERASAQREGQHEDRPPPNERTDHTAPGKQTGRAGEWRAPKVAASVRLVNPAYGPRPRVAPMPNTPRAVPAPTLSPSPAGGSPSGPPPPVLPLARPNGAA